MTNTTHLYNIEKSTKKIQKKTEVMEKDIQTIIEKDLETYLGIRFIDTEYTIRNGRIDTIGIDENGVPVIIEYKRSMDTGAAMQGLYYLAWLMDHKPEFRLRVLEKLGDETSQNIDWSQPRVICIANDFKKYVVGAIDYMGPNIELMQYQLYENGILSITDIHTKNQQKNSTIQTKSGVSGKYLDKLNSCNDNINDIFENLKTFVLDLDSDIVLKELKQYAVFRSNKNFAYVEIYPKKGEIQIILKGDPDSIKLEEGFTAINPNYNVFPIVVHLKTLKDLEKAKPLIVQSYNKI